MKDKSQLIGILLVICALVLMFRMDGRHAAIAGAGRGGGATANTANDFRGALPDLRGITSNLVNVGDAVANFQGDVRNLKDVVGVSSFQGGNRQLDGSAGAVDANNANGVSFPDGESLLMIENDALRVAISSVGGAIKFVELKKYPAAQGKDGAVAFNNGSDLRALALASDSLDAMSFANQRPFDVVKAGANFVELSQKVGDCCVLRRKYSIASADSKGASGYTIEHSTAFENVSDAAIDIGNAFLFLGIMPATESDPTGDYLNFGSFDGKKDKFIKLSDFKASGGFLGLWKREARGHIFSAVNSIWGSIKNQFFTAILTSETVADGHIVWPVYKDNGMAKRGDGCIAAAMAFKVGVLGAGKQKSLQSSFYVGPKDFSMLSKLGNEQDRVMQFGFFGSISELLLWLMVRIHSIIPNWGWTIIALTTIVKLLLWPLTNAQVRSSKKMSAIQGQLKEIRDKFKNNPQKIQAATLKLFKENRINPAAGCLPIFIQIPIFFGLYYMLRTSSNLRFAHFLWIKDLSLPDTIAHFGNFPVNILPIIMGITMFLQMQITPMPTADGAQKLVFKLLPAIFLLCCYSFPSGLVLYWTVQNLLTITQQLTLSRGTAGGQTVARKVANGGEFVGTKRRKRRR
jgi:YidC/Oxa1 family membrane protein insertase